MCPYFILASLSGIHCSQTNRNHTLVSSAQIQFFKVPLLHLPEQGLEVAAHADIAIALFANQGAFLTPSWCALIG